MRQQVRDPVLGGTVQLGVPVTLSATPGETRDPLHRHRARIIMKLSITRRIRFQHRAPATWRRGRSMASQCSISPATSRESYGPMILAQLGANVIKIENLEGDAFRSFGFGFLGWNQGKRGLAIDLNSREGLDIVYRLAEEATCWWKISAPAA